MTTHTGTTTGLCLGQDGPILTLQLDAPESGNALTAAILDDLLAILSELHDRPDIRVLVLSGAGADFCLGADREEFRAAVEADRTGGAARRIADKAQRVCDALETTHAVTVARLHGRVIGAGLALAAFCDLRVGTDTASFRMPEVGLGLPVAWGGALGRLVSEAGAARIRELMLTCEQFDAVTAHRISLLHKVVTVQELDAAVAAWAKPLSRRPAEALAITKRMLTGLSRAQRTADTGLLDAHLLVSQMGPGR